MKLAVIFTGGTIGSANDTAGITPQQNGADGLLRSVQGIQYVCKYPFTLLSENSTGLVLRRLADCIGETLEQRDLDGILITHGTDTLAYSAAAMGYLFAKSRVPIVFVSSNYILEDARANGWDNFRYAVAFISQNSSAKGVYVSYRNEGDVPRIHRATEVISHQVYSDEVFSVCGSSYGYFDLAGDECSFVRRGSEAAEKMELALSDTEMHPHLCAPTTETAPILQIIPYPGMRYPEIPEGTRAILHHSYHAGTICGDTPEAEAFFAKAGKREIPVFLCGVWPSMRYAGMRRYADYGIHVLPVASPVAMYMKLWLLLEGDENVVEWMSRRIAGEGDIV